MKPLFSVALETKTGLGRLFVEVFLIAHTHTHTPGRFLAQIVTYTTRNKYKRRKVMPSAGFKLAIRTTERPQTHALDHTATGIA